MTQCALVFSSAGCDIQAGGGGHGTGAHPVCAGYPVPGAPHRHAGRRDEPEAHPVPGAAPGGGTTRTRRQGESVQYSHRRFQARVLLGWQSRVSQCGLAPRGV